MSHFRKSGCLCGNGDLPFFLPRLRRFRESRNFGKRNEKEKRKEMAIFKCGKYNHAKGEKSLCTPLVYFRNRA
jgi:hypothetical protein